MSKTRAWACHLALAFLAFAEVGCQSPRVDSTSGETHFLRLCDPTESDRDPDSARCGDQLSCLCNVCTLPCAEQSECASLPGATCVQTAELSSCATTSPTASFCAVECTEDSDCTSFSGEHVCLDGVCLEGPVQDAGPSAQSCMQSAISANEVLIIGDSFFAASHAITGFMEELARGAGVIAPGERYRDNSKLIENALSYMGNGIASQYTDAVAESPVSVVIMNGGGADALLSSCASPDTDCPAIEEAAAGARELFARMAQDGAVDVLYVFYPNPLDDPTRAMVDALRPLAQEACDTADLPCHWIDLRPLFEGHYDEYIEDDGLNPTTAGALATAEAIWAMMQRECIAQ